MDSLQSKIQKNSKIMTVIATVLCISLIAGLLIPVIVLIWHAIAPATDLLAFSGLGFYSSAGQLVTSTGELIAEMWIILVSGIFVLPILLLARGIFYSTSKDIMPFSRENAERLHKIAAILLVYSIVQPIAKAGFYKSFSPEITIQSSLNINSVILALIFLFISIVFTYGADLQRQSDETL